MLVGRPRSKLRVDGGVDIGSQRYGIDGGKPAPSRQQLIGGERTWRQRSQLSDRPSGAGNRDRLTPCGTVHDLAAMVS
jgi:hypothetical protein